MEQLLDRLHAYRVATLLALLAFLIGFSLGILFGIAEGRIKKALKASATTVLATRYKNDGAAASAVVRKSFRYLLRAHLHAGVLGACALSMILLLTLLGEPTISSRIAAFFLGAGASVYGCYWLVAGFTAPSLGGTSQAKETFEILGMGGGGMLILGLVGVLGITANRLLIHRRAAVR